MMMMPATRLSLCLLGFSNKSDFVFDRVARGGQLRCYYLLFNLAALHFINFSPKVTSLTLTYRRVLRGAVI